MKKALIIVLLAGVAAYIGMVFFLGSAVRAGVNAVGPRLTNSRVTLGSASLSPLSGSGTLGDFVIGNPPGWSDQDAITLRKVSVKMEPFSIFGDHIVIDEVLIDGPVFNYETKFVSSNIKDLLANIGKFSGGGGTAPTDKGGHVIKFVVRKFRLTNGTARIGVGAAGLPVPLPPISLDDLGVKEGGITPDQLAGAIMTNVLGSIVSGTADAMAKIATTTGANTVEKSKDVFKKLFGTPSKP